MFIKDSGGTKSLTATMVVISFLVVMVKVLFNGAEFTIGGSLYSLGSIDALTIGAIFGPILGSYTARRWNDPPTVRVPVPLEPVTGNPEDTGPHDAPEDGK